MAAETASHGSSVDGEVPAAVRTARTAQLGRTKWHMPKFPPCSRGTECGSAVHDKDSADTDLDGQVQGHRHAVCRTAQCLCQSGERGIVPYCQGEPRRTDLSNDAEI